ncbi:MAG: cysteine desulfurase IscS [Rhodothermaceae bacterium]|nr:MAG: cysteine desulfurase IscS [Rhodothermaceae bacterium]
MKLPVYLDYNATTPVDPVVLERMLPFFREHFGNPSSTGHAYGWAAEEAVTQAREQVAGLLGATPEEIVFTSGATEAINMAIKGVAEAYARKGRHVVTVQTEHAAVLGACRALERRGFRVTYLPVAPDGRVAPDDVAAALTEETILVAVMWANNETGVLQPVEALGEVVRAHGALFLCDATQAVGKVPVTVEHVDLLACSAHKFYGPKGVGALYVRQGRPPVRLAPLLDGGSQEGGRRAGTLNVPGIVGMGGAAARAWELLPEEAERLQGRRDRMEKALREALPEVVVNGAEAPRLPQTSSLTFRGVRAANLIARLRTLALSTGSACSSADPRPSHVLKAMGRSDEDAASTLRVSLGRFTTDEEVRYATDQLIEAVRDLRGEAAGVAS